MDQSYQAGLKTISESDVLILEKNKHPAGFNHFVNSFLVSEHFKGFDNSDPNPQPGDKHPAKRAFDKLVKMFRAYQENALSVEEDEGGDSSQNKVYIN